MLNTNLEFNVLPEFNFDNEPIASVFFSENLSVASWAIHQNALLKAKKYLIAEADLLAAICEVDRDKTYEGFGETFITPYCIKYLGLSGDVAANFVRVARKSIQVPELKTAIDEGRLTVTKAKTIASIVTPLNQQSWINKAQTLSKEKLEREVANASPLKPMSEKAKARGHDKIRVEFELSFEDMELFCRAQDIASQKLRKSATLAETQGLLLECFLGKHDPVQKAARAQSKTRKNQSAKRAQKAGKVAGEIAGEIVSATDQSRDRSLSKARQRTKSRSKLPAGIIHNVNNRDRGCCQARLPDGSVCGKTRWVHLHHIKPVSEGGKDLAENLVTLCSSHHRLWHS
jgi:hypothetical protein